MSLNGKLNRHKQNSFRIQEIFLLFTTMRPDIKIAGTFNKSHMLRDKLRPEIKQCVARGLAGVSCKLRSFDNKMVFLERNLQAQKFMLRLR